MRSVQPHLNHPSLISVKTDKILIHFDEYSKKEKGTIPHASISNVDADLYIGTQKIISNTQVSNYRFYGTELILELPESSAKHYHRAPPIILHTRQVISIYI